MSGTKTIHILLQRPRPWQARFSDSDYFWDSVYTIHLAVGQLVSLGQMSPISWRFLFNFSEMVGVEPACSAPLSLLASDQCWTSIQGRPQYSIVGTSRGVKHLRDIVTCHVTSGVPNKVCIALIQNLPTPSLFLGPAPED